MYIYIHTHIYTLLIACCQLPVVYRPCAPHVNTVGMISKTANWLRELLESVCQIEQSFGPQRGFATPEMEQATSGRTHILHVFEIMYWIWVDLVCKVGFVPIVHQITNLRIIKLDVFVIPICYSDPLCHILSMIGNM